MRTAVLLALALIGCETTRPGNTTKLYVDAGPTNGHPGFNVAYVTIEVCAPGTSTCATIDHVQVDTGSVGLRLATRALPPELLAAMPPRLGPTGGPLAECEAFATEVAWGSVRAADVTIGRELASDLAVQIVDDDAAPTRPDQCAQAGPPDHLDFSYGMLGVFAEPNDCGAACESAANLGNAFYRYYECGTTGCTPTLLESDQQLQNPVTRFPTDNNGVILELPDPGAHGAGSLEGQLVFGIGTQANNFVGDERRVPVYEDEFIPATLAGEPFPMSFFDSGSAEYFFETADLPTCAAQGGVAFYCPTSVTQLTATLADAVGANVDVGLSIRNGDAVDDEIEHGTTAIRDVAAVGFPGAVDFGLPFYYGRRVIHAITGRDTPVGPGPYVAF